MWDTFSFMESSSQWIQSLEAWVGQQLRIITWEYETAEIRVEESADIGFGIINDVLLNLVL